MMRSTCTVLLFLLTSTLAFGQESRSPQTAERVRPCTLHPVNGRVCLSEGVLRGFLMRYVPPKLPEGVHENGDVLLHVIVPPTGGRPARVSVVSGNPVLARSAVRAVRDWVFMAYAYEDTHLAMEGDLHVRFKPAK